jgi:hypothetical protein
MHFEKAERIAMQKFILTFHQHVFLFFLFLLGSSVLFGIQRRSGAGLLDRFVLATPDRFAVDFD